MTLTEWGIGLLWKTYDALDQDNKPYYADVTERDEHFKTEVHDSFTVFLRYGYDPDYIYGPKQCENYQLDDNYPLTIDNLDMEIVLDCIDLAECYPEVSFFTKKEQDTITKSYKQNNLDLIDDQLAEKILEWVVTKL